MAFPPCVLWKTATSLSSLGFKTNLPAPLRRLTGWTVIKDDGFSEFRSRERTSSGPDEYTTRRRKESTIWRPFCSAKYHSWSDNSVSVRTRFARQPLIRVTPSSPSSSSSSSPSSVSASPPSSSSFSSSAENASPPAPDVAGKKENIATIPNILTASRMALSPVIGYLVLTEAFAPAMVLFCIAGVSDMLDGYIARNFPGQASTLGMAIDPLADKLLMTIVTLSLTWADLFPTTLTVLIITRDVLLILAGFALRYISLSPPVTLRRYFDVSLPSAEVYPTNSSKVNTLVQLVAVAASLTAPLASWSESPLLHGLWVVAGVTTVVSGASYAYNGASCFKILSEEGGAGAGKPKISMRQIQMLGGAGFTLGFAFVCFKSF